MMRPSSGVALRAAGKEIPKRSLVGAGTACCARAEPAASAVVNATRAIERADWVDRGMHEIREFPHPRQSPAEGDAKSERRAR